MDTRYDSHETRCPLLGHPVPFCYCRALNEGLPCSRLIACWQAFFEIGAFIEDNYTPEQCRRFLEPPGPKLSQIVALARKSSRSQE